MAKSPQNLTAKEYDALPPEEQECLRREAALQDADFGCLMDFIDLLIPLCRDYQKAMRLDPLGEAFTDKTALRWGLLTKHLLSLPTYAKGDPGWFARILTLEKRQAKRTKKQVQRRKAQRKARESE